MSVNDIAPLTSQRAEPRHHCRRMEHSNHPLVHVALQHGSDRVRVVIIAGEDDRLIDIDDQSARLHADVPQSSMRRVKGAGHMAHQTATAEVMSAIDEAVRLGRTGEPLGFRRGFLQKSGAVQSVEA
jgi:pimeloyl-ACP methyl ester carboxylesterase